MKILLLHLSDLHISESSDPIMSRAEEICSAVRNIDYPIQAVFGVVSGDLANTGSENEYFEAISLLDHLSSKLITSLPDVQDPKWFLVPGNHDCNFEIDTKASALLRDSVRQNPDRAADPSVLQQLTAIQEPFFSSLALLDAEPQAASLACYTSTHEIDEYSITFVGYNTAITSERNEDQGTLIFPPELCPDEAAISGDICVSVFHHPYNWLNADHKRPFQEAVQDVSDIVLTGHEHESTGRDVSVIGGESSRYLEGGVLQDRAHGDRSSFNVLLLDFDDCRQKFFQFKWDGKIYRPIDGLDRDWGSLQMHQLRATGEYVVRAETEKWLRDPGVTLTHRDKETILLEDIFVYPELERVDLTERTTYVVRSSQLFETLRDLKNSLITGPEAGGKTTLAKKLFVDFRRDGFVPLYLSGDTLTANDTEALLSRILQTFEEHYASPDGERFRQLEPARRVILVDDLQSSFESGLNNSEAIKFLTSFADRTVILAGEFEYDISQLFTGLGDGEDRPTFARFAIEEFGHYLRQRLVDNWLALGKNVYQADEAFAQTLKETKRKIDTILGSGLVPSYPVFILSILQALETSTPTNVEAGSYGAFYELFIRTDLATISTIEGFNIKVAFLGNVAFRMFVEGGHTITSDELQEVNREYQEQTDLRVNLINLVGELVSNEILVEIEEGRYRFKYEYAYYYFVATYLKFHLEEESVRETIKRLCQTLHVEDHANILLFLTHLEKDPFILNELVEAARSVFPDVEPETLEELPDFFEGLEESVRQIVYVVGDPMEGRDEALRARDRATREDGEVPSRKEPEQVDGESLDSVNRLNSALKMVQILGQVLKNFPGTTSAERKQELLSSCYGVGTRALAAIYEIIGKNRERLIEEIVQMAREDYPDGDEKVKKIAQRSIVSLTEFLSAAFINRISRAVGSEELDRSLSRVRENEDVPVVDLIDCSARLESFKAFPETEVLGLYADYSDGNVLAESILKQFVVHHFTVFPRPAKLRQRMLKKLNIPYKGRLQAPADPKRVKRSGRDKDG